MKVDYSVTFEYETRAPDTHRGVVEAASLATCVSRATKVAKKALRPVSWSSVVCVILGRHLDESPLPSHVTPSPPPE